MTPVRLEPAAPWSRVEHSTTVLPRQYFDDFFLGCPFRHTDLDLLKQKLKSMSIGTEYYDKVRKSYYLRKLLKINVQKLLNNCAWHFYLA